MMSFQQAFSSKWLYFLTLIGSLLGLIFGSFVYETIFSHTPGQVTLTIICAIIGLLVAWSFMAGFWYEDGIHQIIGAITGGIGGFIIGIEIENSDTPIISITIITIATLSGVGLGALLTGFIGGPFAGGVIGFAYGSWLFVHMFGLIFGSFVGFGIAFILFSLAIKIAPTPYKGLVVDSRKSKKKNDRRQFDGELPSMDDFFTQYYRNTEPTNFATSSQANTDQAQTLNNHKADANDKQNNGTQTTTPPPPTTASAGNSNSVSSIEVNQILIYLVLQEVTAKRTYIPTAFRDSQLGVMAVFPTLPADLTGEMCVCMRLDEKGHAIIEGQHYSSFIRYTRPVDSDWQRNWDKKHDLERHLHDTGIRYEEIMRLRKDRHDERRRFAERLLPKIKENLNKPL